MASGVFPLGTAAPAPALEPPIPRTPPWSSRSGVDAVVETWLSERAVLECLAAERTIGAQGPQFAALPAQLDQRLVQGLARRGITRLYAHQSQAVEAALSGRHVVIAT